MRFFLDNNIPPPFLDVLRSLSSHEHREDVIEHLRRFFKESDEDTYWLAELKKLGDDWIIVCGDKRITRSPQEQAAWLAAGLTTFFLWKGWMHLSLWDMASRLVRTWPEIRKAAAKAKAGTGFKVKPDGKIEELLFLRSMRAQRGAG